MSSGKFCYPGPSRPLSRLFRVWVKEVKTSLIQESGPVATSGCSPIFPLKLSVGLLELGMSQWGWSRLERWRALTWRQVPVRAGVPGTYTRAPWEAAFSLCHTPTCPPQPRGDSGGLNQKRGLWPLGEHRIFSERFPLHTAPTWVQLEDVT